MPHVIDGLYGGGVGYAGQPAVIALGTQGGWVQSFTRFSGSPG